jgi:transposase
VHSRYTRKCQDLPIQGKKTVIMMNNRKFFCKNPGCSHKTFAEKFDFVKPKATKTDRLQNEITRISLKQSSVSAAEYLRGSVCDVGKSTICDMLKKTNRQLTKGASQKYALTTSLSKRGAPTGR